MQVARYLGDIMKVGSDGNVFYYYPRAEIIQINEPDTYSFKLLRETDLNELFPNSDAKRILFTYYRYKSQKSEMETHFDKHSLTVCEFYRIDLDTNFSPKYGYTLPAIEYIKTGKIHFIHELNIFHVLHNANWIDNFINGGVDKIYLQEFDKIPQGILCGEKILIQCDNDFLAGPCEVRREPSTGLLYVTPPFTGSKYILNGYDRNNLEEVAIHKSKYTRDVAHISILKNNTPIMKDFLTDEELVSDFKSYFADVKTVDEAKINSMIDRYSRSVFWGIPSNLQNTRLQRLRAILLESNQFADAFSHMFDMFDEDQTFAKSLKDDIEELRQTKLLLEREIKVYTRRNEDLMRQNDRLQYANANLKADFERLIESSRKDMAKIAFDGFIANRLIEAATNFGVADESAQYKNIAVKVADIPAQDKTPAELIKYLCGMAHTVRPAYDRNTIINIAICLTQGFLTVFYGEPGCGKTSICNIFAEILGLNRIAKIVDDDRAKRYIPVSVEKGWTSKRDFTGYYNPLTKTFDKNNRRIYDALRLLDLEKRAGKFPCVILLDEANLSPMEHYWSDFMNICDGVDENSHVNLGADSVFTIPETLRFVATINNDHTTENLSPRLIDRAWLVALPNHDINFEIGNLQLPADKIEIITWKSLINAFTPNDDDYKNFPAQIYKSIIAKFGEQNLSVSPRIHNAVKNYCAVASKYFSGDNALDYAVAQRILPKIVGNGEDFRNWLGSLGNLFAENDMIHSAQIVRNIIERGNNQLDYYGFFL